LAVHNYNDQIKKDDIGGAFSADKGEGIRVYLVDRNARRKRPLEGQRHTWVHNINMGLGGVEWGGEDSIGLA
jgi:hypothetical protein